MTRLPARIAVTGAMGLFNGLVALAWGLNPSLWLLPVAAAFAFPPTYLVYYIWRYDV
jgi:hypothetical protein